MKAYNLCISPRECVVSLAVFAVITLALPSLILLFQVPATLLVIFLTVAFVVIVGWQWWFLLTLAYRVVVHDDGSVEWVALARRVRTLPEEIHAIRPYNRGVFRVLHSNGEVRFPNLITGLHEIIVHIKGRNSNVLLKGC